MKAASIANEFGTLSARGNVNLTAGSIDNLAGTILSTAGDVNLAASTITNHVVAPVTTHISYGNENPSFAQGCNGGGTYKGSECNVDRQNQASAAAIISGARNVSIDGDYLVNTGGLITAGADANISISNSITNTAVALNTYWQGHWIEETCWFCSDKAHDTHGVVADGVQVAGIQAGNALTVIAGGNVLNTGNIYGSDVSLTGSTLTNGITDSNQPSAATALVPQLVTIGPSGTVVTGSGVPATNSPIYAVNMSSGGLLGSLGPDLLVANLPASLRPDTNLFYYDASTESNLIRQEALKGTGSGTFIKGVSWSTTNNLSIDDQQKAILYNNAIQYATDNNLQLGKPLTQAQIAALDKPMLWYTEQTVPDPACSFQSTTCGHINALMPQVYLPASYASNTTGGVISGNDVKLTFSQSITNTGIIEATNLAVKTASLTNELRSVDIGVSDYKVQGGWVEYSGTQLQPGGFMSAVNLNVQADRITAIGDAFRVVNADGTRDEAGTNALLNSLRQQLGGDFTEIAAHDNIHTDFIKDTSGPGAFGQVIAVAVAVAMSVMTGGTAGLAVMQTVTGSAVVAGSTAAIVAAGINAAIVGTLSSIATQVITTGRLDLSSALQSGAVSGLVAGLTAGTIGNAPGTPSDAGIAEGASNSASTVTPSTSTATQISQGSWKDFVEHTGTYTTNTAIRSGISAAINSAVYGGSFGAAFVNGIVADAAATGANGIGDWTYSADGNNANLVENLVAHSLLGCAASAAGGTGCAGGALGAFASAAISPDLIKAIDPSGGALTSEQKALISSMAILAGGALAQSAGASASAGANWAANEVLNNATTNDHVLAEVQKGGFFTALIGTLANVTAWQADMRENIGSFLELLGRNGPNRLPQAPPDFPDDSDGPTTSGGLAVASGSLLCIEPPFCAMTPPVIIPVNAMASSGSSGDANSGQSSKDDSSTTVPGRVQSRINLDSEGFDHIDKRHFDATVNASQFSISRSELADILMDGKTVATPVTKIVKSGDSFNYVRELNLGKAVGTDKFNGYQSTSIITIMTDKFGNLVTAFPGRL